MIKKLKKIQNFGVYNNFNWKSNIPEFQKYNLIFGWNYSGKTTLSRVFRSFELNLIHKDYIDSTFEMIDDNNNTIDQTFQISLPIKVFNSDFVKDNLKWEEGLEPIFYLGEENIELQKQLYNLKEELKNQNIKLIKLETENKDSESKIETTLTDYTREIGTLLSLRQFNKTHFRPIVDKIVNNANLNLLSNEEFDIYKAKALSNDKKPFLNKINVKINSLNNSIGKAATILEKQITSETIDRLKNHLELSKWIELGKELHKNKDICEFCGGNLKEDLIEKLNRHFSEDFENLKNEISNRLS